MSDLDDLKPRLVAALERATRELLAERTADGHWTGELSSSALSTATAVIALAVAERESKVRSPGSNAVPPGEPRISNLESQIAAGLEWLALHANAAGGWGDTIRSVSNLSTTALGWAAFGAVPGADAKFRPVVTGAERWLAERAGGLDSQRLAAAVIRRYGNDRTFSVPILTACALAGRLGRGADAWRGVLPLPFELAACPHQWFAALRLPVVSYALPALIAIGQARHFHRPTRNPITRLARNLSRERTLRILSGIQPSSGGFLEATPLTSFVVMSLAGSGQADHPVVERGVGFLRGAHRPDGSWPIDTNLATWLTTLAVNALGGLGTWKLEVDGGTARAPDARRPAVLDWLLAQQFRVEHPYTHAAPGGWAWTDLPGGVPDADDTAGALRALAEIKSSAGGRQNDELRSAALAGVRWLLDLQNSDGGVPTFCRGWGKLAFDQSSADLTAHAIRAWLAWLDGLPEPLRVRTRRAVRRAVGFLARSQRADGAWAPLWFGNEFAPDDQNLTYGTARVSCALAQLARRVEAGAGLPEHLHRTGLRWLVNTQNADGGWGGAGGVASSVEETALAVEALACGPGRRLLEVGPALQRGAAWLVERVESGAWREASPIGFYFAKLWYFERLYPLIFTVGALRRAAAMMVSDSAPGS